MPSLAAIVSLGRPNGAQTGKYPTDILTLQVGRRRIGGGIILCCIGRRRGARDSLRETPGF
jgi:hypothetical protein